MTSFILYRLPRSRLGRGALSFILYLPCGLRPIIGLSLIFLSPSRERIRGEGDSLPFLLDIFNPNPEARIPPFHHFLTNAFPRSGTHPHYCLFPDDDLLFEINPVLQPAQHIHPEQSVISRGSTLMGDNKNIPVAFCVRSDD